MAAAASGQTGRIFISYRRDDTAYPAGWLYDRLSERLGSTHIFKDVDNLEPGDDFVEKITDAVTSCDVLLAVIGPDWETITDQRGRRRLEDAADFVRVELEVALARGVRVIPILVEGARMPSGDNLPDALAALTRRHALVLTPGHFNRDADELIVLLRKILDEATRITSGPRWAAASRSLYRDTSPPPDAAPEPVAPVVLARTAQPPARSTRADLPAVSPPVSPPVTPASPGLDGHGSHRVKRSRRRPLIFIAIVALLVALGVAGYLTFSPRVPINTHVDAVALNDNVIVWRSVLDQQYTIGTIDVQTKQQGTALTGGGVADSSPVISQDRRTVIYKRDVFNPAGAARVKVATQLRAVDANGQNDRLLFSRSVKTCSTLGQPAWNSAKGVLAFVCGNRTKTKSQLDLVTMDGALIRQLAHGNVGDPTFTRDSRFVVFWQNDSGNGDGGSLVKLATDGTGDRTQLTQGKDGEDADPACSPNSDVVVFRRHRGDSQSLQAVGLNDGADPHLTQLTTGTPMDQNPSWSPDGSRIAFRRGETDLGDLWVMDANGGHATSVTADSTYDGAPAWSTR